MTVIELFAYLAVGIAAGVFAGFFGLGGGVILVPALVWIFHLTQHQAQGMSLTALVLPVGILSVLAYYRSNPFPVKPAFVIAFGLFLGAYVGGTLAQYVPDRTLRILFGCFTVLVGIRLILGK